MRIIYTVLRTYYTEWCGINGAVFPGRYWWQWTKPGRDFIILDVSFLRVFHYDVDGKTLWFRRSYVSRKRPFIYRHPSWLPSALAILRVVMPSLTVILSYRTGEETGPSVKLRGPGRSETVRIRNDPATVREAVEQPNGKSPQYPLLRAKTSKIGFAGVSLLETVVYPTSFSKPNT